MSRNNDFSTSLKYLLIILLENNLVDDTEVNAYEQTPRDLLISNMIDEYDDINIHKKHANVQYSVYLIFSNLKKYKSILRLVMEKLRTAVLKSKHKMSHKGNLTSIVCSPPGQVEHAMIESFPGGKMFCDAKVEFYGETLPWVKRQTEVLPPNYV
tara:strand:+ start:3523 stop:3987 length:465 start_codon:yes stop_codon:yes gene_type:complete